MGEDFYIGEISQFLRNVLSPNIFKSNLKENKILYTVIILGVLVSAAVFHLLITYC